MRYIFPKKDFFEDLVLSTEYFFNSNDIDVTSFPTPLYNDILCSLIVNSMYFILEWKNVPDKEIKKTLEWVIKNKRKKKDQSTYYEYNNIDYLMSMSIGRLKVALEKCIDPSIKNKHYKDDYLNKLIDRYYYNVLDDIDISIKRFLENIFTDSCWEILEVVETRRTLEIISYGDFRINAWEMYSSKT